MEHEKRWPKDDFLQKVRELANENNIILIFDECTSGFRKHLEACTSFTQ